MTDQKKPELVFMPGCFDHFEGTQEELDELKRTIQEMFDSGEMEANAVAIDFDQLIEEDPEMAEVVFEKLNQDVGGRTLH